MNSTLSIDSSAAHARLCSFFSGFADAICGTPLTMREARFFSKARYLFLEMVSIDCLSTLTGILCFSATLPVYNSRAMESSTSESIDAASRKYSSLPLSVSVSYFASALCSLYSISLPAPSSRAANRSAPNFFMYSSGSFASGKRRTLIAIPVLLSIPIVRLVDFSPAASASIVTVISSA